MIQVADDDEFPREVEKPDGTLHHLVKEGARYHVLSWSTSGTYCSEPRCEINKRREDRQKEEADKLDAAGRAFRRLLK